MAKDAKYGDVHVEGIPEDEPIFILRAQDAFAIHVIDIYAALRESARHRDTKARMAISEFRFWQDRPDTKVKLPD